MSSISSFDSYAQEVPAVRDWLRFYDVAVREPELAAQARLDAALHEQEHHMAPYERQRARMVVWQRTHAGEPPQQELATWARCSCWDCRAERLGV